MKKEIESSSIPSQIEKLIEKGLRIDDKKEASTIIEVYGYYNVINSYKEPYTFINDKGVRQFYPNISFDQIFSLFQFDHRLRNAIMVAMIDLEEHLRATAADVISTAFGTNVENYLNRRNYQNRKIKDPRFRLDRILCSMKKTAKTNNDNPISYYRNKYGTVPPWILFKGIFFSTLVNYIRLFKNTEKDAMIYKVFGIRDELPLPEGVKNLFTSTLFLFLDYRNLTAHGGRVYNYTPKSPIFLNPSDLVDLEKFIQNPRAVVHTPGLEQLLLSLQLYRYKSPFNTVVNTLNSELNRHCSSFPDDIDFIQKITGITVLKENTVWISKNSKIYHKNGHCGSSKHLHKVSLHDITEQNYRPCKRCF